MRLRLAFLSLLWSVLSASAQTALTPPSPAIPAPPSPALIVNPPALSPAPGTPPTATTTFTTANLAQQLLNLQTNIELVLPLLGAFNNNFDFVDLAGGGAVPLTVTNSLAGPGTVGVATNLFLLSPGGGGTNGFLAFPLTRETLRGLLILQMDMERMLPVLQTVNGLLPPDAATNSRTTQ